MRLKTFTAPTMAEAMDMVRGAFGDDAIIVSTEESDIGIKIVTAVEEQHEDDDSFSIFGADHYATDPTADPVEVIHEALLGQGLPNPLLERLIEASFSVGADDPVEALAGALTLVFHFLPLRERRINQPLMLIGAPGSGKTVTVAKLAARAVFAHRKVRLITADTVRAGAIEQLDAFARLMKLPLHTAESDHDLARFIAMAAPDELVLIDSAGVNPYAPDDMAELAALVRAAPIETILVQSAGGDATQLAEHARVFATLGCSRLLVTQLDMTRRYGGMLAAADAARLPFCDFSMTSAVHEGLTFIDPLRLAGMLLPQPSVVPLARPVSQGLRS
jgi:flagellar biosynthesis protein FlhF